MTDEWSEWRQKAADIEVAGMDSDDLDAAQQRAVLMAQPAIQQVMKGEQMADEIIPIVVEEETAVVVAQPQQHLVVGVGALAAMDDAAFERNLAMLQRGQDRLVVLTDKLLVKGVDYGTVPGIKKPFLQKPGAEKLANFYGLAVSFDAQRVEGDGVKAPPLAYHVKALVHLRDTDGPVVAEGYGESNSWEPKYRYVESRRTCPACGREGLVTSGKQTSRIFNKWWCPGREGGCNKTYEKADPRIVEQAVGKVDNPDPYGYANTLIKIAEKRALVDGILRATGTSGFFTQDEDSPAVQAQASGSSEPDEADNNPPVENVTGQQQVERGGKPTGPTPQQIAQLTKLSKEKDLGPDKIAEVITRLFDVPLVLPDGTRGEKGKALLAYIQKGLTADQFGQLLHTIDTGEVPATPGFPPQQADER